MYQQIRVSNDLDKVNQFLKEIGKNVISVQAIAIKSKLYDDPWGKYVISYWEHDDTNKPVRVDNQDTPIKTM